MDEINNTPQEKPTMSKKTITLIVVLAIVAILLVVAAVSPKGGINLNQVMTNGTPTPSPVVPRSVLSFSPNPLVTTVGKNTLDIVIDGNGDNVSGVDMEITYDPKMFTLIDIAPTDYFENVFVLYKKIDPLKGKMILSFAIPPGGTGKKGSGAVARISFTTTRTMGETMFTILPSTVVTAQGVKTSVLKESTNAKVVFSAITPTKAIPTTTPSQ